MCAVIKRGILGGVQNKIGNVVGSSWKGIATLRSLPLSVANPKTAAQTAVRSKFASASKLASAMLAPLIKPLWDRFAQQQSGYNAWIQANIENFSDSGEWSGSDFTMSKGSLAVSAITSATADASAKSFTINWEPNPIGDANPTDNAYIVLINQTTQYQEVYAGGQVRSDGSITGSYSGDITVADELYAYLSFRKADGTKVSDSTASEVTISA